MDTQNEFRSIPGFPGYIINRDGLLKATECGGEVTWYVSGPTQRGGVGGYYTASVMNEHGKVRWIGRHRLLALAFLGAPDNVDKMVINHRNGIPGDDRIENLEWVTRGQNNQHAYDSGLKSDAKPILVKNMISGEVTRYNTIALCARALGYTTGTFIYWRLNKVDGIKRYSDEIMFKYDDGTPWPEVDWFDMKIHRGGVEQDYVALNLFTKELQVFRGLNEGQRITGIDKGTICSHVNHGRLLPMNGWIVRFMTASIKWPKFNERILAICRDHPLKQPHGLVVLDTQTGEETFYTSTEKACEVMGLKKQTVWQYHRENKLYKKRYRFSVFNIHEAVRSLQCESTE